MKVFVAPSELDPFGKQILEQVQRAVKWEINTVVLIQEKLPPFKYRCQNVSYSCNKLSNNTKSKVVKRRALLTKTPIIKSYLK